VLDHHPQRILNLQGRAKIPALYLFKHPSECCGKLGEKSPNLPQRNLFDASLRYPQLSIYP
jgi:hypothetical protein